MTYNCFSNLLRSTFSLTMRSNSATGTRSCFMLSRSQMILKRYKQPEYFLIFCPSLLSTMISMACSFT